jgi:hypothetical protein
MAEALPVLLRYRLGSSAIAGFDATAQLGQQLCLFE